MSDLAHSLYMSQSEVSQGLKRLLLSKLIDSEKKMILSSSFYEFLCFGLKYSFPAILGPVARGIPTAHSSKLIKVVTSSAANEQIVWEFSEGKIRGQTILPLYKSAPKAALEDQELYKLLALVDVVRIGMIREVTQAKVELKKSIVDEY